MFARGMLFKLCTYFGNSLRNMCTLILGKSAKKSKLHVSSKIIHLKIHVHASRPGEGFFLKKKSNNLREDACFSNKVAIVC